MRGSQQSATTIKTSTTWLPPGDVTPATSYNSMKKDQFDVIENFTDCRDTIKEEVDDNETDDDPISTQDSNYEYEPSELITIEEFKMEDNFDVS